MYICRHIHYSITCASDSFCFREDGRCYPDHLYGYRMIDSASDHFMKRHQNVAGCFGVIITVLLAFNQQRYQFEMVLKNFYERAISFLRQQDNIKVQLLANAQGAFVLRALKSGYLEYFSQSINVNSDFGNYSPSSSSSDTNQNNEPDNNQELHDARINKWFRIYTRISTGYIAYANIRNILGAQIEALISIYDPERAHCYLGGAFILIFYIPLSKTIGFVFAISHISWRIVQAIVRRPLKLTMIFFMLQSDTSVQKHLQLFGHEHTESRVRSLKEDGRLTRVDLLLHKILYYTVRHRTQVVYKLRPNRTLESRRLIADLIAESTFYSLSLFCALFLIIFPPTVIDGISDLGFIRRYPNCVPELDGLAREGKLPFWSFTPRPYRIYALILDLFENLILWIDSANALYFSLPFIYQLNFDVMIYWRHLHKNLAHLLSRVELNYVLKEYHDQQNRYKYSDRWTKDPVVYDYQHSSMRQQSAEKAYVKKQQGSSFLSSSESHASIIRRSRSNTNDNTTIGSLNPSSSKLYQLYTETRDLDREVLEMQAEITDFFRQIEMVDAFVSDILSASIIIWMAAFAIITYFSVLKVGSFVPSFLRTFELVAFTLFTLSTFFLLSIHRKTMLSYRCIVSLMALDQSEHKRRFLKILEFFTGRNRSAYTVFHRTPFLATTYLSIIGWSLSSLFIIESLFHRNQTI